MRIIWVVLRHRNNTATLRVAFGFPEGISISHQIQKGILCHAKERGGWLVTRYPELLGTPPGWLRDWRGDGAFVFATTTAEAKMAASLPFPVVNLVGHLPQSRMPTVSTDHYEVGRLAAGHLLSKNFQRVAYYGTAGLHFSDERMAGFRQVVGNRATISQLLVPMSSLRWYQQETVLEQWLGKLERPVGIFAVTDLRARMILDACERMGIRVPQGIAVIGVDNDRTVCELCDPSLSSVARNDFEVGRQAAILLETLVQTGTRTAKIVSIAPAGVVERQSTRTFAVDDPLIATAVGHIQDRIGHSFGVEEIAGRIPVSRRRFEARFRRSVGRSPYEFINEQRVEQAKILLESRPRLPLGQIAAACGFSNPRRFRLVFRRVTGMLPKKWAENSGCQ